MTDNSISHKYNMNKTIINRNMNNINQEKENLDNMNDFINERKIQELNKIKILKENNYIEPSALRNDLKGNPQYLNTEAQEINKNNLNNLKPIKNLTNERIDLAKIDDLENYSRLLKKKIEIEKNTFGFKIKKFFEKILDNNYYISFMMLITIFILFIDDIQNGWLSPNADNVIEIVQTFIFCLYFLEIVITSICKNNYVYSFFFWLDILSTLYIIQDISFIINPILGLDNSDL